MFKLGCVLLFGTLLLAPGFALAQFNVNIPFALENELNVEVVPTYPRPNESVLVTLTMYTADLDSADIAWFLDGKQILIGRGLKQFSFQAGPVGEKSDVEIRVRLQSGTIFSKSFSLNPASVDLVWEADSYVPPFYKGKALHPRQGRLKIVAMPEFSVNSQKIASDKLIYEWSNGLQVYQSQSGYGRNIIVLNGSPLGNSENIEVLVRDPINNIVAQGFVNIGTIDPQILFYENSPYYGYIFEQAIGSAFDLEEEEVSVTAFPYFFTKESGVGLQYSWRLNGKAAPELTDSRTAVFRKPEGEVGQSLIALNIENPARILQFADTNLNIRFND